MIIKIYDDGCMAEIILVEAKSITADELVCTMLQHGITAAKIVHSNVIQTKPATGEPAINVVHNVNLKEST